MLVVVALHGLSALFSVGKVDAASQETPRVGPAGYNALVVPFWPVRHPFLHRFETC